MFQPLAGLRVLDCSFGTAGPQASGLLADYGAEVIWIEPPGGDLMRRLEPASAAVHNRGKRSVTLDLENAEDRQRVIQLAREADVFIEGWRPGQAETLGLGFETLQAINPALIYVSIAGFSAEDRHSGLPPYEGLAHALVGTAAVQAAHRDGPVYEAVPFASMGAARLAVIGLLAALYRTLDDGVGRHVETSLKDGALVFHQMLWSEVVGDPSADHGLNVLAVPNPKMLARANKRLVTRSFLCGDGEYIGIHTGAAGAFGRLMSALGLSDVIKPIDGIEAGTPLTDAEADYLENSIHQVFASRPRHEWIELLTKADVCAVEHLHPAEAFDHPQVIHNESTVVIEDPVLGRTQQVAPALRFEGGMQPRPRPAPRAGEHTAEVLGDLEHAFRSAGWLSDSVPRDDVEERPLLEGVKVIDVGAYYAGPFASRMLADFGAQVVKLEPIIGEQMRGVEKPFLAANANKKSLSANLKSPEFRPVIEDLVRWADVIHQNMRPGVAERLGLGLDQAKALNPDLIYLYAPGWGSSGPHHRRQSFAPMLSGYVGATYEVAGQYNEPLPPAGHEDPGGGLMGAIALLIGLVERRRTGRAVACESPLLTAALHMLSHIVRTEDGTVIGAERLDVLQMGIDALESLYETADGWLCLVTREDHEIRALEQVLGLKILDDERFATPEARRESRDALADALRTVFEKRATSEWLERFAGSDVPVVVPAAASAVHDLLNSPDERRLGRVAESQHPARNAVIREIGRLVRISGATFPPHRPAPALGQDTDELLGLLGVTEERIAAFRAAGDVR